MSQYLGDISAYALAVSQGYTGTEEEYAELMASYATVGQTAVTAAQTATTKASEAATSATTATNKATEATTAARTATTKAAEASQSASQASTFAQTASMKASEASALVTTATEKATEATTAAGTATTAKDDAVSAKNAAETAQAAAETAQGAAEDAAESVSASAEQIATNTADISDIKENLNDTTGNMFYSFTEKTAIANGGSTATLQRVSDNDTDSLIVSCSSGDKFTISGEGWSSLRLWAFCGSESGGSYPVLDKSVGGATANNLVITAPENASYLVMNVKRNPANYAGKAMSGISVVAKFASVETEMASTNEKVESITTDFYGVNRCPSETVSGYLNSSGEIVEKANWQTTDFCFVGDLETVYSSAKSGSSRITTPMYFTCIYNANKELIFYVGDIESANIPYTVPSQAKYIRYTVSSSYSDIKLENGADANPNSFVPYSYQKIVNNSFIKKWIGKKWTVVGDSITAENIRTTKHYFDYVSEKTWISIHNMGVSGSGYAQGSATNTAFYQRISNVPTDSDVITIFGSFNDNSTDLPLGTESDDTTTTIGGCVNTTLDNLFTAFPLANVGIVTPCPWELYSPQSSSAYGRDYCELLVKICKRRSIPCLDLFYCSGLRPWDSSFKNLAYTKDDGNGTHPDETGHFILSTKFEAFLDSLLLS